MWYLAACWNPNPRMCSQIQGVIRNFIWGGKATPAQAKVKWDTLILPISKGGLGIIDPKTQSKAFLAKLLIRGFTPQRGTVERVDKAPSQSNQTTDARQRP
jgi:hypothetical protein